MCAPTLSQTTSREDPWLNVGANIQPRKDVHVKFRGRETPWPNLGAHVKQRNFAYYRTRNEVQPGPGPAARMEVLRLRGPEATSSPHSGSHFMKYSMTLGAASEPDTMAHPMVVLPCSPFGWYAMVYCKLFWQRGAANAIPMRTSQFSKRWLSYYCCFRMALPLCISPRPDLDAAHKFLTHHPVNPLSRAGIGSATRAPAACSSVWGTMNNPRSSVRTPETL